MNSSDFAPNFSYEELTFSQTAARLMIDNTPNEEELENLVALSWWLQALRDRLPSYVGYEVSIIVTSGFRCPLLNGAIGGSQTSAHKIGAAADIRCPALTPLALAEYIRDESGLTYDQLIHEFGKWVHVGIKNPREDGEMRMQELTALKRDRRTVYENGLKEVKS